MGLHIKLKTVKPLGEYTEGNLHDFGLGKAFLAKIPKAQTIKENIGN